MKTQRAHASIIVKLDHLDKKNRNLQMHLAKNLARALVKSPANKIYHTKREKWGQGREEYDEVSSIGTVIKRYKRTSYKYLEYYLLIDKVSEGDVLAIAGLACDYMDIRWNNTGLYKRHKRLKN